MALPKSDIRNYRFEYWSGENWITLVDCETPMPTTIHRIPRITSRKVRLLFESSQQMPMSPKSACMTNPPKIADKASLSLHNTIVAELVLIPRSLQTKNLDST